jgi:serine/threonine protein kinase
VERNKDGKKFVCHKVVKQRGDEPNPNPNPAPNGKVVKQRVDEHWGYEMKPQAEDVVCARREVLELCDSVCVARLAMSGLDSRNLYMWVDFHPGGSLELLLKKNGKLGLSATMFYASCAISAVNDMQRKKIIHRDLCPTNLLIGEDGYLKIVGFGRAKILHRETTLTVCGSPYYMSPEMLLMRGHGLSHDVWQLAILIYNMVPPPLAGPLGAGPAPHMCPAWR